MMGYGGWGGYALIYGIVWVVVLVLVVMALWRGMVAQEKIAHHLENIERELAQRITST